MNFLGDVVDMKTMWIVAGAAAVGLLAGCTSLPPGAEPGPDGTMAYDVLIEASPPGARIEANGQVIGNTPIHLKIFGDPDGTFHDFGAYEYIIAATPLATNQFPQVRVYHTGHLLTPEDRIPQRIFFDMNQQQPVYPGSYSYPTPGYYYPPAYYGSPYYPYYYGFYGPHIYIGPRWHHW